MTSDFFALAHARKRKELQAKVSPRYDGTTTCMRCANKCAEVVSARLLPTIQVSAPHMYRSVMRAQHARIYSVSVYNLLDGADICAGRVLSDVPMKKWRLQALLILSGNRFTAFA